MVRFEKRCIERKRTHSLRMFQREMHTDRGTEAYAEAVGAFDAQFVEQRQQVIKPGAGGAS